MHPELRTGTHISGRRPFRLSGGSRRSSTAPAAVMALVPDDVRASANHRVAALVASQKIGELPVALEPDPRRAPKMYHPRALENVPGVGGHLKMYHAC